MVILPAFIFLFLIGLFLASAFGLYRCVRRRRYILAALFAAPFAILAFYFAHVVFGPFQRDPQKVFRYALGFAPPAGCTDLLRYEHEGFNPGVDIWLRFRATPEALASIISQAHFSTHSAQDFSDLQKKKATVDWWTPPSRGNFWLSDEFGGPYSYHSAGLAYDASSQTAFIYVTGFD